uniref:Uncharacterized protein n=1 Tax=Rhizophora mucronata TaxID=61149 RepID=A0A2P2IJ44_RHIMU
MADCIWLQGPSKMTSSSLVFHFLGFLRIETFGESSLLSWLALVSYCCTQKMIISI